MLFTVAMRVIYIIDIQLSKTAGQQNPKIT